MSPSKAGCDKCFIDPHITLIELYQSCDNKGIQLMVSMNAYTELVTSKCGHRLYMLHCTLSSAMNY